MATIKQCDRCGIQMKPPVLTGTETGDAVVEIELRVQQKPWSGDVIPANPWKTGDYCTTCTQMVLEFLVSFNNPTPG